MSAGSSISGGSIDILESAADVAPVGVTRLARKGGVIVQSTDGAPFTIGGAPASALVPGTLSAADFAKLASVGPGGYMSTVFVSDVLDLMLTTPQPLGGNWTSLPGYKIAISAARFFITNVAATTFTVAPTISFGNDASSVNMSAASATVLTTARLNAMLATAAGGPYPQGAFNVITAFKLPDLTVIPSLLVAGTAGTAVTQCKGRLVVEGLVSNTLWPTV